MAEFFRRVEKKYILTSEQYSKIKKAIDAKMTEDSHGKSTICNIYFDTDTFELIRNSIEKPKYKDKVRLRSYNVPKLDSEVFLEVKKKYNGVVSKRREKMNLNEAYTYFEKERYNPTQVMKEIDYYFKYYDLKKKMFLSYDRVALYSKTNKDFRITFDSNVIARNYNLLLENGVYGKYILPQDNYIMEVKILGAIPLWFVKIISDMKLYPKGFSKYGEAYTKIILNKEESYV